MQQRQAATIETIRPATSPMNLDVGRVNPREVLQLACITMLAIFFGTLGLFIAYYAVPKDFAEWSAFRNIFTLLGLSVAFICYGLAGMLIYLTYRDWIEYRDRLNVFFNIMADAMEANQGVEIERTSIASELTYSEPLHILGIALSIHHRVQQGEPTPYSVRELTGAVFLDGTRLGDISTPGLAQSVGKRLADLGLIVGREEKSAGRWTPNTEQEVIEKVAKNWRKI